MRTKFEDVPLHLLGDAIIATYAKAGFEVAISITVIGPTGQATGTSNMEERAEVEALRWVIDQRTVGAFDSSEPHKETKQ